MLAFYWSWMDKWPKTEFRQSHFLRMICEQVVNTSDYIKIHIIKTTVLLRIVPCPVFNTASSAALRFHCVQGCWWDRTQDCCDFGIDRIFCTVSFEMKGKRGRRKLRGSKCQNLCCMSQKYSFLSQRGTLNQQQSGTII
jgi:hypothetical protein